MSQCLKTNVTSDITTITVTSESSKAVASDKATEAASVPAVQRGLVLHPVELRVMFPKVAVSKNASTAGPGNRTARSRAPKPQSQYIETYSYGRRIKTYICNICNHLSSSKKEFNAHHIIHLHKCKDCKTGFSSKISLQNHKCTFCTICNKKCSRWSSYIYHRKCHYKETFKCETCQEKINIKNILMVRRPTYIGFYAVCPRCRRKFTSFLCNDCAQPFPSIEEFSKHSHGQCTEYRCSICNEDFEDDFSLTSHKRSHAPQVKEYTRTRKNQEVSKPIEKVREPKCNSEVYIEDNVNLEWFNNIKDAFYNKNTVVTYKRKLVEDLENDWLADAVKEEPLELTEEQESVSEVEAEIECLDESISLKTVNTKNANIGVPKMFDKNVNKKIDQINLDGVVENEPEKRYDVRTTDTTVMVPKQVAAGPPPVGCNPPKPKEGHHNTRVEAGSSRKRARLDETISPRGEPKKQRTGAHSETLRPGYVEVPKADLLVAITTATSRHLNPQQSEEVQQQLQSLLMQEAMQLTSSPTPGPMFRGKPTLAEGSLRLSCQDQATLEWLKRNTATITLSNGEKLVVRRQSEIPKRVRCGILFPGVWEDFRAIAHTLRYQNPWAEIDQWLLHRKDVQGTETFAVVSVPETVVQQLVDHERRLAFMLGSVYVKFQGPRGKYGEQPPHSGAIGVNSEETASPEPMGMTEVTEASADVVAEPESQAPAQTTSPTEKEEGELLRDPTVNEVDCTKELDGLSIGKDEKILVEEEGCDSGVPFYDL